MVILFSDNSYRADAIFTALHKALGQIMPDAELRRYPDIGNAAEIDYAIIWYPAPGSLQNLPNLKAIFTTSAGVDGIIHDDTLPDNIPIVRNTDPGLAQGMAEYVTYHTLRFHRDHHILEQQRRDHVWKQVRQAKPSERRIGILGMGEMGQACARALNALQFPIASWSRTRKNIESVESFFGDDQFDAFLNRTDILINVLPLTHATENILNAALFVQLPKGAFIINAGRGRHLIEADLIDALDNGHLAAAALDVFRTEPLPTDHPFWLHPKITITPHIASITDMHTIEQNVHTQIHNFESGEPLKHVIDRVRQY